VFESITAPDAAARLRNAAVPPLAAFLFAQLYFTLYPMLTRVPAALFWLVVLVLYSGAIAGIVLIVRTLRAERVRGINLGWAVLAAVMTFFTARLALALTLPWL
jgi:hypothetical protein